TGVVRTATAGVHTTALFADAHGGYVRVPVEPDTGGRFTLVPPSGVDPRLAGFLVSGPGMTPGSRVDWRLDGLTAPLDGGRWQVVHRQATGFASQPQPTTLAAAYPVPMTGRVDFAVVPAVAPALVPVAATPAALTALRLRPGQAATLTLAGVPVEVTVARAVEAVPGTEGGPALLADLPSLAAQLLGRQGVAPSTQEWWLATRADAHPAAAAAATGLPGIQLVDRRALAGALSADPFGAGARTALFGAAVAAVLLAAIGVAVDVQATTRRRAAELTVLYTLGSAPRLLTRSLLVEQALLAGFGALTGLLAGVLVAAVMAPLLVLTSAAARPVPAPVLAVDWPRAAGTGVLLVLLALGLTALAAYGLRRRLAAGRLTIGSES
ncbi:MAG TPA: FtsX-like permease family protein, partial [Actinoplanes sp.]|nr:FtsX-like permease family protein [Actinoplanes sp.]